MRVCAPKTRSSQHAAAPPHPRVVLAVPGRLRLWHKPDTEFKSPKAVLYLDVQARVCMCACVCMCRFDTPRMARVPGRARRAP
jgi:hypothetical protein